MSWFDDTPWSFLVFCLFNFVYFVSFILANGLGVSRCRKTKSLFFFFSLPCLIFQVFVVLVLWKDIPINEYDSLEISPRLRHVSQSVSQRCLCLLGLLSLKTRRRHRYIYMQAGNVGERGRGGRVTIRENTSGT